MHASIVDAFVDVEITRNVMATKLITIVMLIKTVILIGVLEISAVPSLLLVLLVVPTTSIALGEMI